MIDRYGPPINTPSLIYWTALVKFIARQALARWGVVIGVSDNVLLCSFLHCHQSIGREGGGHNSKKIIYFFNVSEQKEQKSFLQEKNRNILVGGYPHPLIGKRPIYFRFFLMKASLSPVQSYLQYVFLNSNVIALIFYPVIETL